MKTRPLTYDSEKVKELRMELIMAGLAIMQGKAEVERWSEYKREYILKVGSRALPVLNAGRDDDKDLIPEPLLNGLSSNNSNQKASESEEEDS